MTEFQPKLPPADWARIEGFVRDAVAATKPKSALRTKDLLSTCTAYVHWCWQTAGLPLEAPIVFSQDVIEEFALTLTSRYASGTAANRRTNLYTIARAVLGADHVPARMNPLPKSEPQRPFSAAELVMLRHWADGQTTPGRRHDANVLIAVGAGAGLSAAELRELRVRDVTIDEEGVLLRVRSERARSVPVLFEWEERFPQFVTYIGDPDGYLFRPSRTDSTRNVIANFVDSCSGVAPRASLQRLRATWLVHHLTAATPPEALLRAAGLDSLEALTRYVRYVPGLDESEFRQALREARRR